MRNLFSCCCLLGLLFSATTLTAQELIYAENFNACALPAGWQVKSQGNPNPVWYVGLCTNTDAQGQSIDGSCFLMIDDDATGDSTQAYVLDIISPPFDASKHSAVYLLADIHYRDWYEGQEKFQVLVTDGTTETLVSTFDESRSNGALISEVFKFRYDLSLVTHSPNARLIFRYDDGGDFNWWAGVDNIIVAGLGSGHNVVAEAFNACTLPPDWSAEIVSGQNGWNFGIIDTSSQAYWGGTSLDGTCFAFFDDDKLGEFAPYSTVRLATPWFDGTQYSKYTLSLDVILRYYKEKIAVLVEQENGETYLIRESEGDVGGPQFPQYVHAELDLSQHRHAKMRVVFEYTDGNDWGWWAGIDNVKITGEGSINDKCSTASLLLTGADCVPADNLVAILDGPPATCTERTEAGLWYRWTADFAGLARFDSHAQFNDVVNVYTGGCADLQPIACNNHDEHGFTGETTYFQTQPGQEYWIRVSGNSKGFGIPRGALCPAIQAETQPPQPPLHDDCANAIPLLPDQPCVSLTNRHAAISATLPPLNQLARADVWYTFTAPALQVGEKLVIESGAAFSNILTVYAGGCAALSPVAANHHGSSLDLTDLTAGATCHLQVAGNFATVEGSLCVTLSKSASQPPANDHCSSATPVALGAACVTADNTGATFSGHRPPCVPEVWRDIWFSFVAPASGSVLLNTGADFEHVLTVWQGSCDSLSAVFCAKNPRRCDGYILVPSLHAGDTYLVQIAAWSQVAQPGAGQVCLSILPGNATPPFQPLVLTVKEVCTGENLAKLNITTAGGVAPLSFQGATDDELIASGTPYLSVVTDAMGCEQMHLGVVKACAMNDCALVASISPQSPKCFGGSDGSLTANLAGGMPPYVYAWSVGGGHLPTLSGLSAGTYTLSVTDAIGCELTLSATVPAPAEIMAAAAQLQQPHQGQSDGFIQVDVGGGTGGYTFQWLLNGSLFSQSEHLVNAPAGEYLLVVTDANACQRTFAFTLTAISSTSFPAGEAFAELFPNPAADRAMLTLAFPQPQLLYLSIVDATGRVLQSRTEHQVTERTLPIQVSELPAGVYQLRLLTGQGLQLTKQLVVER